MRACGRGQERKRGEQERDRDREKGDRDREKGDRARGKGERALFQDGKPQAGFSEAFDEEVAHGFGGREDAGAIR